MSYPALTLEDARRIDAARRQGDGQSPEHPPIWKPGPNFLEETAKLCLDRCWEILEDCERGNRGPAEFDCECAPVVHETLDLPFSIAHDPDFWRWLTFGRRCDGANVVDRRYGGSRGKIIVGGSQRKARPVYYGLGPMKKGMFAKLWICANLMYVKGAVNPYDGCDYADVDLWDSHVIDVDYGSAPSMARAFVKVVRDLNLPRDAHGADVSVGYRQLAKEIRRRHASIALELFTDVQAYEWVKAVWNERDLWCRS